LPFGAGGAGADLARTSAADRGGDFLVEGAKVLVLLWLDEGEGAGERVCDGDLTGAGDRFEPDCVLRPGNLGSGARLDGEAVGQVKVTWPVQVAIAHIDGCVAFS